MDGSTCLGDGSIVTTPAIRWNRWWPREGNVYITHTQRYCILSYFRSWAHAIHTMHTLSVYSKHIQRHWLWSMRIKSSWMHEQPCLYSSYSHYHSINILDMRRIHRVHYYATAYSCNACIYTWRRVGKFLCTNVSTYVHPYSHILCMYVNMYVLFLNNKYVCIYVCMYVCMYVWK